MERVVATTVRRDFPGQLFPTDTTGGVVTETFANLKIQSGLFGSIVITLLNHPVLSELGYAIQRIKDFHVPVDEKDHSKGNISFFEKRPVYVCIPFNLKISVASNESLNSIFGMMTSLQMTLHMYDRLKEQLVFKGGNTTMVPDYGTSIEGVTGLIFSKDEHHVLLVFERGGWSTPGGAVDLKDENILAALERELGEEVGVKIDTKWKKQRLIYGWHESKARQKELNDNFKAFAVKVTDDRFTVDGHEITTAKWIPWREVYDAWDKTNRNKKVTVNGETYLLTTLEMMEAFALDRGMKVKATRNEETGGTKLKFTA